MVGCQSWLEMAYLPVTVHSIHLYRRKQSPYPRLKPLLFVRENLNIVLLTRLIAQLPTPFVICGDFNGHSVTWGCDKNNSRGDRIDDFITDNNVCLLNDGSYNICTQPQKHSQPLICLCVLRTFLWRLILWLNQIHTVVIIFLLFKKLVFHFLMHYPVGI